MKKNILILFLLAVSVLALTGCAAYTADGKQNTPANHIHLNKQSHIPNPAPTESPSLLSQEEAIAIALTHAERSAEQVTDLSVKYDPDDGVPEYEVRFTYDNHRYEYELHGQTGRILSVDIDRLRPAATEPTGTMPAPTSLISKEEAIAAALSHAGLEQNQVTALKAELDRDDGRCEYDIGFRHGNWEYEYEINAETGAVITWEREYDKFD